MGESTYFFICSQNNKNNYWENSTSKALLSLQEWDNKLWGYGLENKGPQSHQKPLAPDGSQFRKFQILET